MPVMPPNKPYNQLKLPGGIITHPKPRNSLYGLYFASLTIPCLQAFILRLGNPSYLQGYHSSFRSSPAGPREGRFSLSWTPIMIKNEELRRAPSWSCAHIARFCPKTSPLLKSRPVGGIIYHLKKKTGLKRLILASPKLGLQGRFRSPENCACGATTYTFSFQRLFIEKNRGFVWNFQSESVYLHCLSKAIYIFIC